MSEKIAPAEIKTLPLGTKVEHRDHRGRGGIVVLDSFHLCGKNEVLVRFDGAKCSSRMRISDLVVLSQ